MKWQICSAGLGLKERRCESEGKWGEDWDPQITHQHLKAKQEATPLVQQYVSLWRNSLFCNEKGINTATGTSSPSTVNALWLVYCHFILKGCTSPWCLSTAMQVIVRISDTTAVDWTNGIILQMKAPAAREQDKWYIKKNKSFILLFVMMSVN